MNTSVYPVWTLPLPPSALEPHVTSPQQRRFQVNAVKFHGTWSPRLEVRVAGYLDQPLLLRCVIETINAHVAMRTFLSPDRIGECYLSRKVELSDVRYRELSTDGPSATLWKMGENEHELRLQLFAGSVDTRGLFRSLEDIIDRYNGALDGSNETDPTVWDIAHYFNRVSALDTRSYWRLQLERQFKALPLVAGVSTSDRIERKIARAEMFRVRRDLLQDQDPISLRSALAQFWAMTILSNSEEATGFGIYAPGFAERVPNHVGSFGRYIPLGFTSDRIPTSKELSECIKTSDAMADFFPCDELEWRFHRTGFRFDHVRTPLLLGASPIEIVECFAPTEPFDVELSTVLTDQSLCVSVEFNEHAVDAHRIGHLAETLETALHSLAFKDRREDGTSKPSRWRSGSSLIGETKAIFDAGPDLFAHFESQVQVTPDRIAASCGDGGVTFFELLRLAEQVDAALQYRKVGIGDGVAICMKRRPYLLAALLGIMRRGAFFIPLDYSHPVSRLNKIVTDAAPVAILCDDETELQVKEKFCRPVINICAELARETRATHRRSDLACRQTNVAYVLYTSGTTGVPKGVPVSHSSLLNYTQWAADRYDVKDGGGAVVFSSIAFDMTVTSLFVPLICGQTVHLIAEDEFSYLVQFLEHKSPTLAFLKLTPSALVLLNELTSREVITRAIKHIVLGGERVDASHMKLIPTDCGLRFTNEYGPTETTVGSIAYTMDPGGLETNPVPIGEPIWNTFAAIVSPDYQIAARGVSGQIIIGGVGVAKGYRGRLEETSERFKLLPHIGNGLCYATGDIGYVNQEGVMVYQGRADDQVKIHGYRVELGEVEAVLNRCPGVEIAIVVSVRHNLTGKPYLSAFVKPDVRGSHFDISSVHSYALEHLPSYARPDRLEVVHDIPLALSGKVDRRSFIERSTQPLSSTTKAPSDPARHTRVLAAVWRKMLGSEPVGPDESFFAAGGDSIKALHFVVAARGNGLHLSVADILNCRTFRNICEVAKSAEKSTLLHERVDGEIPLSPAQRAYLALHGESEKPWYIHWLFPSNGATDLVKLGEAAARVRNAHPSLRSQFRYQREEWTVHVSALVDPEPPVAIDLEDADDAEIAAAVARHLQAVGETLSLARGDTVKLCRIDLGENRGIFLSWVVHHLVSDIVSLQIMSREILEFYIASGGEPPSDDDGYKQFLPSIASQKVYFPSTPNQVTSRILRWHSPAFGQMLLRADIAERRMASALVLSVLAKVLPEIEGFSEVACICVERQGRGDGDGNGDLAEAVGWLTNYQLVDLSDLRTRSTVDLAELFHPLLTADSVPRCDGTLPPIAFNFLGSSCASVSRLLPPQITLGQGAAPGFPKLFPLEVVSWIDGDSFATSWEFDVGKFGRASVEQLIQRFEEELAKLMLDYDVSRFDPSHSSARTASNLDLARIFADYEEPTE